MKNLGNTLQYSGFDIIIKVRVVFSYRPVAGRLEPAEAAACLCRLAIPNRQDSDGVDLGLALLVRSGRLYLFAEEVMEAIMSEQVDIATEAGRQLFVSPNLDEL